MGGTERTKNSTTWLGAGDGRGQRSEIRGTLMGGHLLRWLLGDTPSLMSSLDSPYAYAARSAANDEQEKKSTPLATTHHTQRENKPEIEKHTF